MQMQRFRSSGGLWLAAAMLAVFAGVQLLNAKPPNQPVSGRPMVIDGDTLRFGNERVRLMGIDAPELAQSCQNAEGANWPCGEVARKAMVALIAPPDVKCEAAGRDRYGRILAHCRAGGTDLGHAMVAAGLAVSDGDYFGDEGQAQMEKKGIWVGNFTPPAVFRQRQNAGGDGQSVMDVLRSWFR